MRALHLAWLARRAILRAALLPFLLLLAYLLARPVAPIFSVLSSLFGAGEASATAALVILHSVTAAIGGLFVAALLEALFTAGPLEQSLPRFLPSRRALGFALALLPIAAVGYLFYALLGSWVSEVMVAPLAGQPERLRAPGMQLLLLVLGSSTLVWLPLAFFLAPLATRLLKLPALGSGRPAAWPSPAFAGLVLIAVLLEILAETWLRTRWSGFAPSSGLAVIGLTLLLTLGRLLCFFGLLSVLTAGVALLLRRRAAQA